MGQMQPSRPFLTDTSGVLDFDRETDYRSGGANGACQPFQADGQGNRSDALNRRDEAETGEEDGGPPGQDLLTGTVPGPVEDSILPTECPLRRDASRSLLAHLPPSRKPLCRSYGEYQRRGNRPGASPALPAGHARRVGSTDGGRTAADRSGGSLDTSGGRVDRSRSSRSVPRGSKRIVRPPGHGPPRPMAQEIGPIGGNSTAPYSGP